ncbi:ATP-binding cassette domain-containing protein [Iamia sp. SCSIO 61187]|uniref:ATP-binding cassette domain-containing protein n=1 Tax=Iamia sp. SCSIO 61187 TaxID=2722752 RepID=UPI001C632DB2|nr:ATP-binding cassette domain-containing protein [Iamia sp. SCSIO 61187]QYG95055.1 ATP-binding cassette domain-containing protein [Iamia sp. SCSIO 61187]
MPAPPAIEAVGLTKRFGAHPALAGVDLAVAPGSVCGLLGPNGAGKTTVVRILTTLLRPDGGVARVAGHDVVRHPGAVRAAIGVVGQSTSVDEVLTGRQNLELFGRLAHLGAAAARDRAVALLDRFGLADAADRAVSGYSGGMRRRLDLAASLILAPAVLFLDEPTTGLDPAARAEVWDGIRALVAEGTTLLLTTQYLEEADQLADRICVLGDGRVVAEGTPSELKSRLGGDRVEVEVADAADVAAVARVLATVVGPPDVDEGRGRVSTPATDRVAALTAVVRALDEAGLVAEDIALRRPTLDEVFLHLTGRRPSAETETEPGAAREEVPA